MSTASTISPEPILEHLPSVPVTIPKNHSEHKRLLGLDVLRFVAVTLVVFRHLVVKKDSALSGILGVIHTGGGIGVDIFFVLSGFLVSGLLFREYQENGSVKIGRFLIRRGWKIYPALWALVGFTLLLFCFGHKGFSLKHILGEILFLQNYLGGLWFTTWSLGVEEHFYFFLALLVLLMLRFNSRVQRDSAGPFSHIPACFVFVAAACLMARILSSKHMTVHGVFYQSDCRIDGLMLGVLLSYGWHFSRQNRFHNLARGWRFLLLTMGLVCLVPAFIWPVEKYAFMPVFGVMSTSCGAGMLILGVLSFSNLERVFLLKFLGKLGTYSYSAYLWHGPMVVLAIEPLRAYFGVAWKDWVELLVSFCGTWTFGIIAARAVEIPVLRLRERYFPSRVPNLK